jgi:DNA-binding MarR family transcriptional regulator
MTHTETSVIDEPLGFLLKRASDALRAEVMATVLVPVGLGFRQYICLRTLLLSPGRSNAELARQFSVSPQAMSVVLRELQHRGLVTRPIHSSRARSLPAKLTSDGVKLVESADSAVREAERRFLGRLSVQDQRKFRRMIHVLGEVNCPGTLV